MSVAAAAPATSELVVGTNWWVAAEGICLSAARYTVQTSTPVVGYMCYIQAARNRARSNQVVEVH